MRRLNDLLYNFARSGWLETQKHPRPGFLRFPKISIFVAFVLLQLSCASSLDSRSNQDLNTLNDHDRGRQLGPPGISYYSDGSIGYSYPSSRIKKISYPLSKNLSSREHIEKAFAFEADGNVYEALYHFSYASRLACERYDARAYYRHNKLDKEKSERTDKAIYYDAEVSSEQLTDIIVSGMNEARLKECHCIEALSSSVEIYKFLLGLNGGFSDRYPNHWTTSCDFQKYCILSLARTLLLRGRNREASFFFRDYLELGGDQFWVDFTVKKAIDRQMLKKVIPYEQANQW